MLINGGFKESIICLCNIVFFYIFIQNNIIRRKNEYTLHPWIGNIDAKSFFWSFIVQQTEDLFHSDG